jgi:OPA family glycerol-3-phosphate transporter-like MFS transporter
MALSKKAKNALFIGVLCSVSYLAVYIARNVLSAVSVDMTENGAFDNGYIGTLSFVYLISYAVGQLLNGLIGDKIKARYMISLGLLLAGVTNFIFSRVAENIALAQVAYALTGFFLAMIYGPMTKVVAENTEPHHATRCSLGYTFSSFFGSPLAGVFAAAFAWQSVFAFSSAILVAMAIVCFISFLVMEKRGVVRYNRYSPQKTETGKSQSVKRLIEHQIIKFSIISIVTGVVRTSVVFWLPKYINEYLKFSSTEAELLFSVCTLVIALAAFIAVFVYERAKRNMDFTMLLFFSLSALFFAGLYFIHHKYVNLVLIVLAILCSNASASMLWSKYCPSLRDTGVVSGATGFLDFLSYTGAAIATKVFAGAVGTIGWGNLILIWLGLVVIGVIVTLPFTWKKQPELASTFAGEDMEEQ